MEHDPEPTTNVEMKVYRYRWVQLFIFCLFTVINFMQFLQFTIIANVITKYYGVDTSLVDISGLVFFVVYIVLFLPISFLIEKYNLKVTAIVSTGLTLVGNVIKIFCGHPDRFYLILIGQTFCAIGQVYMLSIPTKFASTWFGANEVSTACALAVLGTQLGAALGALFPPFLVTKGETDEQIGNGIFNMGLLYAVPTGVIFLIVILFFRARPKLPPSRSQVQLLTQSEEDPKFFQNCKTLLKNKDYLLILFSFGITSGLWNSFGIVVNTLYITYFPNGEKDIGIISLTAIIAGGCFGNVLWGHILDKYHLFKKTAFAVLTFSSITYVLMACSIMLKSRIATYFTIPIFGFFTASSLVISYEYALEVTYPIPESVSCSLVNAFIFLFGIIATYVIEGLMDSAGHLAAHIFVFSTFIICTITTLFISSNLKRREANLASNAETDAR